MLYNTLSKYPTQHTYSKWLLQKVPFRLHGSSSLCKWEAVSTWTGTVAPFVVQHSQTILAIAVATLGREFGENLTILEPTMPHSNQKSASLAFPWWSCRIYHMRCGQNFWFSQRTLVQVVNPPPSFAAFWLLTWSKFWRDLMCHWGVPEPTLQRQSARLWMSECRKNNDSAQLN